MSLQDSAHLSVWDHSADSDLPPSKYLSSSILDPGMVSPPPDDHNLPSSHSSFKLASSDLSDDTNDTSPSSIDGVETEENNTYSVPTSLRDTFLRHGLGPTSLHDPPPADQENLSNTSTSVPSDQLNPNPDAGTTSSAIRAKEAPKTSSSSKNQEPAASKAQVSSKKPKTQATPETLGAQDTSETPKTIKQQQPNTCKTQEAPNTSIISQTLEAQRTLIMSQTQKATNFSTPNTSATQDARNPSIPKSSVAQETPNTSTFKSSETQETTNPSIIKRGETELSSKAMSDKNHALVPDTTTTIPTGPHKPDTFALDPLQGQPSAPPLSKSIHSPLPALPGTGSSSSIDQPAKAATPVNTVTGEAVIEEASSRKSTDAKPKPRRSEEISALNDLVFKLKLSRSDSSVATIKGPSTRHASTITQGIPEGSIELLSRRPTNAQDSVQTSRSSRSLNRRVSVATLTRPPGPRLGTHSAPEIFGSRDRRRVSNHFGDVPRLRSSFSIMTNRRRNRDSHAEEERVLVGNRISEGHENYILAYNMLTGIRVAVSRHAGVMPQLVPADFTATTKLTFNTDGSESTPSSRYDFKFKDYAPKVFREMRSLFNLDPADYLVLITGKYILSELGSPGKSGSFFYYSRDFRFIIKTIHHSEHRLLLSILPKYHAHVEANPNTLVLQFYGLHRVKMPLGHGGLRKVHFVVMNNLFAPHREIHTKYDLKGSTWGRSTPIPPVNANGVCDLTQLTLKDLNWLDRKDFIKFGPAKRQLFFDQLDRDVKFLEDVNVMDYSLLLGIHDVEQGNSQDMAQSLSVFDPKSADKCDVFNTEPRGIDREHELPDNVYPGRSSSTFYGHDGGIRATDGDNMPLPEIYYLGIIDCLTHYSFRKRLETSWRLLLHLRATILAVPAREYGARFKNFIKTGTQTIKSKLE